MTSTETISCVDKVAGCRFNFRDSPLGRKHTLARLAHLVKHAVGPGWDVDGDLGSAQLGEGLGIENKEESTFLLDKEAEIKKKF